MTSDHNSLQGAGQQHSPAPLSYVICPLTDWQCTEPKCVGGRCLRMPLSPAERIEMATDSLMGELRQARREVAGQRARGDELERQLAKMVRERDAWRWVAILFAVVHTVATVLISER